MSFCSSMHFFCKWKPVKVMWFVWWFVTIIIQKICRKSKNRFITINCIVRFLRIACILAKGIQSSLKTWWGIINSCIYEINRFEFSCADLVGWLVFAGRSHIISYSLRITFLIQKICQHNLQWHYVLTIMINSLLITKSCVICYK